MTILGKKKEKKSKKITILGLLHDAASRRRTIATPSVATPRDAFASLTLFLLSLHRRAGIVSVIWVCFEELILKILSL